MNRLISIAVGFVSIFASLSRGDEVGDLHSALTTENGADTIIASTNDANRASRVDELRALANSLFSNGEDLNRQVKLWNTFRVLAEIDNTGASEAVLKSYVDLASFDAETRGLALFAYARIAQRVRGDQAMLGMVQPYLQYPNVFISKQARASLAATNTPEAVAQLQTMLDTHRAALPAPGFVVTEQNGNDIEARFGAVILDAEALHSMQLPEAKAKAQETLTFLQNNYSTGPAVNAVQYLAQRLAQP